VKVNLALVARAGVGMPVETKKARSVVALSRVLCWGQSSPVRLRLPVTYARKRTDMHSSQKSSS